MPIAVDSGVLLRATLGVMLITGLPWVGARAAEPPASPAPPFRHVHHEATASGLEGRVQTLSSALDLDSRQQAELRMVLLDQRNQIARVWGDASMPAAVKVGSTQAIGDNTASRIRKLLNDEQRKKYIQPRQREAAVGAGGANLASWVVPATPRADGRADQGTTVP